MTLRSNLERVSPTLIEGWAWETTEPTTRVSLVVSVDKTVIGRCLADQFRGDLVNAGIGDGVHGFQFRPVPPLVRHVRHMIEVRREGDGVQIAKSPLILEGVEDFDEQAKASIARVLTVVGDDADFEARLSYVMEIENRLRQLHAERRIDAEGRTVRQRMRQRWAEPDQDRFAISRGSDRPRALVLDDHIPLTDHDAGSNAVMSHMCILKNIGFDVTFAPVELRGDSAGLTAHGIDCFLHPWYSSIEEILLRHRGAFDLVYLHRVSTAARYIMLVRAYQPRARVIYSVADLHHLRLARQGEVEGRPELLKAGAWVRLQELTSAWLSDAVITHSTAEAALLRQHVDAVKVHVVPWTLTPRPTTVPFSERRGFGFIGGYGHQPNVDAALWLVEAVLPEVEMQGGSLPCLLVGSDMPDLLRRLHRPEVESIGYVPDLSSVFNRVRLTVAPLAFGAGVKGKVLDSLAAGVPCVCTPCAAEGLDLPAALLDLVADTPEDLAQSILALHNNSTLNRICSEAGLAYITATANEARLDGLMQAAAGRKFKHDVA